MPSWLTAAKAYRDRAEQCRRIADDVASLEIRMHYLEIADQYIALAEAEESLAMIPQWETPIVGARHRGEAPMLAVRGWRGGAKASSTRRLYSAASTSRPKNPP
jgi:predicted anti-sigma-YlaC factor YlaD